MHPISRRKFPSAVLLTTSVRAQPGQLIQHHSALRLIRWMARARDDMYRPTVAYQLRITRQISEHAA